MAQSGKVLAVCMANGSVGQWYRFRIDLDGTRVCAYIDESRVADVLLAEPVAGKVGLYVEGERGASIDDISVTALKRRLLDRPEVLSPGKSKWRVSDDAVLLPNAKIAESRMQ